MRLDAALGPMRILINAGTMCFILLLVAHQTMAEDSPIAALDRTLSPIIRTYCPEAQIKVTSRSYSARCGFTLHERKETGKYTVTETYLAGGPPFKDLLLFIDLQEESQPGWPMVPKTTQSAQATTVRYAMPVSKDQYLRISFSYGSNVKKEFKKAILNALPKPLPPA